MFTFDAWTVFGFAGAAVFALRFVIQWLYSEYHKKSVVPMVFWYLSLLGAVMIFIYAFHMRDAVFMLAQGLGLAVYVRNIILLRNEAKQTHENGI